MWTDVLPRWSGKSQRFDRKCPNCVKWFADHEIWLNEIARCRLGRWVANSRFHPEVGRALARRSDGVRDRIFLGGMVTGRTVHPVTVRVAIGHVPMETAHVPMDLVVTVTVRGQAEIAQTVRAR
jgi:hypothetical protein